jgi:hypothetical protein
MIRAENLGEVNSDVSKLLGQFEIRGLSTRHKSFAHNRSSFVVDLNPRVAAAIMVVGGDSPTAAAKETETPNQPRIDWLQPRPALFLNYSVSKQDNLIACHVAISTDQQFLPSSKHHRRCPNFLGHYLNLRFRGAHRRTRPA